MAKQKSFHEKVVQKMKRDAGFAWTGSFVEDMLALVEGGAARSARSAHPVIGEGFVATLQQEAIIRASDEEIRRESGRGLDDPFVYPGLMAAWESAPVTVDFAPGVLERALEDDPDFYEIPDYEIRGLFPACLMFDVRGWKLELYGVSADALFAYPSYDDERGYEVLLAVAVSAREGLGMPLESKLVMEGGSLADMLEFSVAERERMRGRCLSGIDQGLHDVVFSPFEDEEKVLLLLVLLLGLLCWHRSDVEAGVRRGVPHWHVVLGDGPWGDAGGGDSRDPDAVERASCGSEGADAGMALEAGELLAVSADEGSDDRGRGADGSEGPDDGLESETGERLAGGPVEDSGDRVRMVDGSKDAEASSEPVTGEPPAGDDAGGTAQQIVVERDGVEAPAPGSDSAAGELPAGGTAGETAPQAAGPDGGDNVPKEPGQSGQQGEPSLPEAQPAAPARHDEAMRLRDLLAAQESKSATLEYHLKQARSAAEDARRDASGLAARAAVLETMDIPQTPAEALALAERAFPDRLVILPEARKSAEEFRRGSAAEMWAVLRSIAMVLHPLVFGRGGGNIMRAFQDESGFEVTLREMKMIKQSGQFSRLRTVEYKGEMRDVSAHVKGRGSKRGETLRVHFLADYDEPGGRIVVAHCGEHLETHATPSL